MNHNGESEMYRVGTARRNLMLGSLALPLSMLASPASGQEEQQQQRNEQLRQQEPVLTEQEAAAEPTPDASATSPEGADIVVVGRFLDTGASSAMKMDVPVLDTPFTVSSYTGDFMKAVETTSISDLYRYMTGVQRAGNTGYDITMRGFKTGGGDRNAILTDGLPGLSVRFGSPPTIGVDHVEVVKGPTSVLYGQAQPGGFINLITKKPKRRPGYEFAVRGTTGIGDFRGTGGMLGSIDMTGPLAGSGTLLYRFVGEIGDSEGFRDFSFERPIYAAPSFTWNIAEGTMLTLQGEHRRTRTHYDNQLVIPRRDVSLLADYDTSYQNPKDFQVERGTVGNAFLTHEFSEWLQLNAGYRYVYHFDSAEGFDSVSVITNFTGANAPLNFRTLRRRARNQENIRTYGFGDTNLTAKFSTFGLEHQLLVGGSFGRETSDFNRLQFWNAPTNPADPLNLNLDIYNPVYSNTRPLSAYPLCNIGNASGSTIQACSAPGSSLTWRKTTQKSLGVYASNLITFSDQWKAMVGVRYADERQFIEELRVQGVPEQSKSDKAWLPLAGLIFQPIVDRVTLYGSYSSSFVPVSAGNQDIFGRNPFRPTRANSIEGGIKVDLLDGDLTGTAAVYKIRKKRTINTFTCPASVQAAINLGLLPPGFVLPPGTTLATGTCSAELGGEQSKGFELEIAANPLEGWNLSAGWSHTLATVTESVNERLVGARLPNSAENALNIWSRYDFLRGPLAGFGVGLGVSYLGDRVGLLPGAKPPTAASGISLENEVIPLPAYTLVDAGLYYTVSDNLDLTLKVSNLFDRKYLESAGFTADVQIFPGAPRTATLSARVKM